MCDRSRPNPNTKMRLSREADHVNDGPVATATSKISSDAESLKHGTESPTGAQ